MKSSDFRYLLMVMGLVTLVSSPSFAEIEYLQMKGVHALVKPEYEYLSPLQGFTLLKSGILKNMRFHGNYQQNPAREDRRDDIAGDSTSKLIQILFPSPDGVNFVPNQVPSQPASQFA